MSMASRILARIGRNILWIARIFRDIQPPKCLQPECVDLQKGNGLYHNDHTADCASKTPGMVYRQLVLLDGAPRQIEAVAARLHSKAPVAAHQK